MPYVMKVRGAPVVIVRTYACDDCNQSFQFSHHSRDEEVPSCPFCAAATARNVPGSFAITGAASKAIDLAWDMAERDYGMTDMNDNMREGDVAARAPAPIQSSEREAIVRQIKDTLGPQAVPDHLVPQVNEFWKTGQQTPLPPHVEQMKNQKIMEARAQAPAARADGSDPMELLHKAKPRTKLDIVARAKAE